MDKQKKEQLILLILVLFLLIMLPKILLKNKNISHAAKKTMIKPAKVYTLGTIERINNIVEQAKTTSEAVLAESGNQSLGLLLDTQEYQDSKNKRDLFDMPVELWKKLTLKEEELRKKITSRKKEAESPPQDSIDIGDLPKIDLLGISWGGKTPLAFIGEKTYKIGDTIEGAKILDINEDGVYFFYRGKKVLIKIKKMGNREDAGDER